MKSTKIIYWTTTALIFLFEGVLVALTWNSDLAVEGIRHLGYPAYFGPLLAAFKVVGALVLIIPAFRGRIKEWAYAGFAFVFISAAVSHAAIDGLGHGQTIFPIIAFGILAASYVTYHKRMEGERLEKSFDGLEPQQAV
jgi:hypothetical protein